MRRFQLLLPDLSAEALVHDGERLWARAIAAVVDLYLRHMMSEKGKP